MRVDDWGLIEYELAVTRQLELVDQIAAGEASEVLVVCRHPAVVTLGRASAPEDLIGWSGPLIEASRGGRATYHGPSQLVLYPVLDLRKRGRDVHLYLRQLEASTVTALHKLGLPSAESRTAKVGEVSMTGVWIGERKIASIGIAVRKWITYHGVAINVLDDVAAFRGIRPCGFSADVMTNLERETNRATDFSCVSDALIKQFVQDFSLNL